MTISVFYVLEEKFLPVNTENDNRHAYYEAKKIKTKMYLKINFL